MTQPQYDMQAHSEQIRHELLAKDDALNADILHAADGAADELADMPGCELLQLCADDEKLDALLVKLVEAAAGMVETSYGMAAAESRSAVLEAAFNFQAPFLALISKRRVQSVVRAHRGQA